MSKNFRGGEATSFMGGTELDFTQADIQGTVVLELTQVMGGAKLIVPSHWTIKNEVNAVLGGVDDKRHVNANADPNKVLVLKGTAFLGGLEIRNY
jgi:predicted membrane protein